MLQTEKLSVLIPVYNEQGAVNQTIQQLLDLDIINEILIINDGSSDNSEHLIKQLVNKNPDKISLYTHKQNKGYGAALKTGLKNAKHNLVDIIDADNTYPVAKLTDLFNTMNEFNDEMVVGSRTGGNVSYPFIRSIPKFFITALANYITSSKIPDINSGLRIFRKDIALKYLTLYPNGFSFTTTITMAMLCDDYSVTFVPIDYYSRKGNSKIRPIRDTINFFNILLKVAMYFRPFKFFLPIVLLFSCISIYSIFRDLLRGDLAQASILFPITTIMFFSIGLLADLIVKQRT